MYVLSRKSRATGETYTLGVFSTMEKARAYEHQCKILNRLNHWQYDITNVALDPLG